MRTKLVVELCLGSSCFARGNSYALAALEDYIEERSLEDRVELKGHLCLSACKSGPHLIIGGRSYPGITDPAAVIDLLRLSLEDADESDIH